jgi:hypothetical protein
MDKDSRKVCYIYMTRCWAEWKPAKSESHGVHCTARHYTAPHCTALHCTVKACVQLTPAYILVLLSLLNSVNSVKCIQGGEFEGRRTDGEQLVL